ncbi:MAG TPA: hypothetical protein VMV36_05955 [Ignavibacteriaceae bacterium]|nr:hypothetical protein [Ignavibacteriaceae bacterium]
MKKALAMTMMMAALSGQSGFELPSASDKSEVEKRAEKQLKKGWKPDAYPDIKLHPKLKRGKTWEQIQELKREIYEKQEAENA